MYFSSLSMKAFKKENKIIFKNSLANCINDLKKIISKIEDKNNEIFPYAEINNFIKNCEQSVLETDDIKIPKEYLDYVIENKEVSGYFEEKDLKANEAEDIALSRKEVINKYKEGIQDILEE
jgi:hypothetical protein